MSATHTTKIQRELTRTAQNYIHQHAWELSAIPDPGEAWTVEAFPEGHAARRTKPLVNEGIIRPVGMTEARSGDHDVTQYRLQREAHDAIQQELKPTDASICPRCHLAGFSNPSHIDGLECPRCGERFGREEVTGR